MAYRDNMTRCLSDWAEQLAHTRLAALDRRWRHVQGVAEQARRAVGIVDDPELLVSAAWLHDVGYAPELVQTGCHAIDGARFLSANGAPERLCALGAHHSCARIEARNRGLVIDWEDESTSLRDALWWADITTTPTGGQVEARHRIEEVLERYGSEHVVARSVAEARPTLLGAVDRTEERLSSKAAQVR